jgi:hypothetical protein
VVCSELKDAMSREAVVKALGLEELAETHKLLELFMISVIKGTGYQEGFKWLSAQIP